MNKALLVGINASPLRGCENDALGMKSLLTSKYGFKEDDVHVLLTSDARRAKILSELGWLREGSSRGTRLFYYSGHGTQVVDESGDEPDGMDEALMPFDHWTQGKIVDDALRREYAKFDPKSHLVLIMDSCNSGTVNKGPNQEVFKFVTPPRDERKRAIVAAKKAKSKLEAATKAALKGHLKKRAGKPLSEEEIDALVDEAVKGYGKKHYGFDAAPGNAVLLAASQDNQLAAEARFKNRRHGVLTHHVLDVLSSSSPTYVELYDRVRSAIEEARFSQTPRLEISAPNGNAKFLKAKK
jgi:hypothetical protein